MRLKLIGRARTVESADDPQLVERLRMPGYKGRIERAFVITVEGYDWNCSQHITPRYTEAQVAAILAPMQKELDSLTEQLAQAQQPWRAP